ncbi:hypothetical protein HG530_014306 [Fusarium avenaceum]|nr:hypothetical protein HG530_014306 [Fusarium avenaceum]
MNFPPPTPYNANSSSSCRCLELDTSLSSRILGRRLYNLSLALHLLLLLDDPALAALGHVRSIGLDRSSRILDIDTLHAVDNARDVATLLLHITSTDGEHEVELLVLGAGVVLEHTGAETGLDGGLGDHVALLVVLGVELADGSTAALERGVEAVEESGETASGGCVACLSTAEPLNSRDTDRRIEGSCSERNALANVCQHQIAFNISLKRNIQH